ncbi:MAG: T9SS type A sorting domain-containing protein [Bacteroidota bacterium]
MKKLFLIALIIYFTETVFSQNATTTGSMNLSPTFNSIGIELFFTGDDNKNSSAILEFKKTGDPSFRQGLPLWRTDVTTAPGKAYYGSALLLTAGTNYDIKITVTDIDGGNNVITGNISTRADNIPVASSLVPTHYVRANGNDANNGTSSSSAWATIARAVTAAPSGAIVQVGPGYFATPFTMRTLPITLVAQYPAIDNQHTVINSGNHSVIDFGNNMVTTPMGSGQTNAGVWQQVTITGPGYTGAPAGATYKIWKWSSSGLFMNYYAPSIAGYANSRAEIPKRIPHWEIKGNDMSTPEGWVEKLYTNKTYNYGWTIFANPYGSGNWDIYIRLLNDADPNTLFLSFGGMPIGSSDPTTTLHFNAPNVRVSGLEVRVGGIGLYAACNNTIIDHNLIVLGGVGFAGSKPSTYTQNNVVEHNNFIDNSWITVPGDPGIHWTFIKGNITNADGSSYPHNRVGAGNETSAAGGQTINMVYRHNLIDGPFNGIANYNVGYDRYASANTDIHDNIIKHIGDDAFEPEQVGINWRIWNNRVEEVAVCLSTGPLAYGPLYLFRNEIWELGTKGIPGGTSVGFKYSGNSNPAARLYIIHNTFWSDEVSVDGAGQYAGGGSNQEQFYLRNNIFRTSRYAFQSPSGSKWNEDYNHFATTDGGRGFSYAGAKYMTNVAGYRTASGGGANTNKSGDFVTVSVVDNSFTDAVNGDLNLNTGSIFIDAGVSVPNISDLPGLNYCGAAPDIGAKEYCGVTTGMSPSENETGITIYPNPFSDQATIFISSAAQKDLNFVLYDILGKEIFSAEEIQNGFSFKREGITNGIYFYRIYNKEGYVETGKLVIQ